MLTGKPLAPFQRALLVVTLLAVMPARPPSPMRVLVMTLLPAVTTLPPEAMMLPLVVMTLLLVVAMMPLPEATMLLPVVMLRLAMMLLPVATPLLVPPLVMLKALRRELPARARPPLSRPVRTWSPSRARWAWSVWLRPSSCYDLAHLVGQSNLFLT